MRLRDPSKLRNYDKLVTIHFIFLLWGRRGLFQEKKPDAEIKHLLSSIKLGLGRSMRFHERLAVKLNESSRVQKTDEIEQLYSTSRTWKSRFNLI